MPNIFAEELRKVGVLIFTAAGVAEATARKVVDSLVLANLLGVDSHGIMRVPRYLQAIESGWIVPGAEAEVVRESGVAVLMKGNRAFGQVVSRKAIHLAIDRAVKQGAGMVSFADVFHIGRLGEWVEIAAEKGFIGIVVANGSYPGGQVAPFGAREPRMGTNPIAFGIPSDSAAPLIADFATSAVAEGKLHLAHVKGAEIPLGWVIDRDGRPTTNPSAFYEGGALLTFGGHKGFSISLLVDVLGGILSGADTPASPDYERLQNGVFMLAIDPSFFRPAAEFGAAADTLFDSVKTAQPAEGSGGPLIPGDPERYCRAEREKKGIPVDDSTWASLQEVARALDAEI